MLSKTAEYALRAVVWLAHDPGQQQLADELARQTGVPRRYLHKLLQDLVKAKLVHSQSGPRGGYALARSPAKITVLDVVNAASPITRLRRCLLGLTSHIRLCPLHAELDRVYAATEAVFRRTTIDQLLDASSATSPRRVKR